MRRGRARAFAAAFALVVSTLAPRARAEGETFGLSISVARKGGARVQSDAWIAEQIARANALFAPAGVAFRWVFDKPLPDRFAEVRTKDDRDDLGALGEPGGVVDVFLTGALEDVDEPGRMRKGVCWTQRDTKKRYVVLSAEAPQGVLAHELGHFFGNPHVPVPDNVMSYVRTGGPTFFDPAQIDRIRSFSRSFLASGRLFDAGPPRLLP